MWEMTKVLKLTVFSLQLSEGVPGLLQLFRAQDGDGRHVPLLLVQGLNLSRVSVHVWKCSETSACLLEMCWESRVLLRLLLKGSSSAGQTTQGKKTCFYNLDRKMGNKTLHPRLVIFPSPPLKPSVFWHCFSPLIYGMFILGCLCRNRECYSDWRQWPMSK